MSTNELFLPTPEVSAANHEALFFAVQSRIDELVPAGSLPIRTESISDNGRTQMTSVWSQVLGGAQVEVAIFKIDSRSPLISSVELKRTDYEKTTSASLIVPQYTNMDRKTIDGKNDRIKMPKIVFRETKDQDTSKTTFFPDLSPPTSSNTYIERRRLFGAHTKLFVIEQPQYVYTRVARIMDVLGIKNPFEVVAPQTEPLMNNVVPFRRRPTN